MANYVQKNPITGELDYFFPMEITDPSVKVYAHTCGFEIDWATLGYRRFLAVYVPCKEKTTGPDGREVFLPTPTEVQHARYLEMIKDEMNEQERAKQDGRCIIPNGHGGLKHCPCRIKNPDYVPGSDQPKTLAVSCQGCKYEPYHQAHITVPFSTMDYVNDEGEVTPYEPASPKGYMDGYDYERLARLFIAYVREKNPQLVELAELMVDGFSRSEAARKLNIPSTTAQSRRKKLGELYLEFRANLATMD